MATGLSHGRAHLLVCSAAFCAAACAQATAPAGASREATQSREPKPSAPETATDGGKPESLQPAPLPDGCFSDIIDADAGAEPIVERLASLCASGMDLVESATFPVRDGKSVSVRFDVDDPRRCLRVVVAADPAIVDIAVRVLDANATEVAKDDLSARFAVVGRGGPFCVDSPGTFDVVVRASGGSGRAAVRVYRAR